MTDPEIKKNVIPDSGIKRIVIPRSSLPSVTANNDHLLRFRIVSDDRNRYSQWSPVYIVSGLQIQEIDSDFFTSGRIVTLAWEDPQARTSYDVFLRLDDGDYIYHGTANATQYSFILPQTIPAIETFQYAIQIVGIDQSYNPSLVLYESEVKEL